jgi:hypothetical protein
MEIAHREECWIKCCMNLAAICLNNCYSVTATLFPTELLYIQQVQLTLSNSLATVFNEPVKQMLLCSTFQISYPFSGAYIIPENISTSKTHVNILYQVPFFMVKVVRPCPTIKLEGHPLSAVRNCLLNTVAAATVHIWQQYPLSATRVRAMPWWQGPT